MPKIKVGLGQIRLYKSLTYTKLLNVDKEGRPINWHTVVFNLNFQSEMAFSPIIIDIT